MNLDAFLMIISAVVGMACFIGYRITNENTFLKYKDQRYCE